MKVYFYIIFFCALSYKGFSQSTKFVVVEYEQKMKISDKEKQGIPKEVLKILEKETHWKPTQLIHKGFESVYVIKERVHDKNVVKTSESIKKTTTVSSEKVYFKNFKTNIFKTQIDFRLEPLVIVEKLKTYNWKLLNETKKIDGLICKKASVRAKEGVITAWYSDSFGIQNGPEKFSGLPGLIVFLENDYMVYRLKKVRFLQKVKMPKVNSEAKIVTRKQFIKEYVNASRNTVIKEEIKPGRVIKHIRGKSINYGKKQ